MSNLNAGEWQKVSPLLDAALALAPEEREEWLRSLRASSPELAVSVGELLEERDALDAEKFLEHTPVSFDEDSIGGPLLRPSAAVAPGTMIDTYEVISLLGAGGMGEVYRARDTSLKRIVAIKFLRRGVADQPAQLRRFEQEAQAAATLNHPHIVAVYQFGTFQGTPFLVTEFLEGVTMRELVRRGALPVHKTIEYGGQIADALASAHARGILHRDLKPENLFITDDDRVKILDFGLAKLRQSDSEQQESALTEPGRVMGTAAYMSPEQARAKELDERTDLFSFGAVLYEMATGRLAFPGETPATIFDRILNRDPVPARTLIPEMPNQLEEIINKALEKDRDLRYLHASDIRTDLLRLKRDYNSGKSGTTQPSETGPSVPSPSSSDQPTSASAIVGNFARYHRKTLAVIIFAFCVMLAVVGYGLYRFRTHRAPQNSFFETMSITRVTSDGKSALSVISPDGKYLVHAVISNGLQSLWTLQLATRSEVQIVPPGEVIYHGLSFSPDDDYVYFISAQPKVFWFKTLYQVPFLGGAPRKIIADVDSPVAFSPDGNRIAYVRFSPEKGKVELLTNNAEGLDERVIATRQFPQMYYPFSRLAWSADGKSIILAARANLDRSNLVEVPVAGGPEKLLTTRNWPMVSNPVWLADYSGLVFAASEPGSNNKQLWFLPYPVGEPHRITNDPNSYENLSLSPESKTIVATQNETFSNLWVAPEGKAELSRRITSNERDDDGVDGIAWTPDHHIVFTSYRSGNLDLWITGSDGSNTRQLTHGEGSNSSPSVSPDGRTIVFVSTRIGSESLWKIDIDGGNPVQLTRNGLDFHPQFSPDGKDILFQSWGRQGIFEVPLAGDEPRQLVAEPSFLPLPSPDGRLLSVVKLHPDPPAYYLDILPLTGGSSVGQFDFPGRDVWTNEISWTRDSKSLTFLDSRNGVGNIWLQPISGGKPRQLTNFSADRIYSFGWSIDGKQLVAARGNSTNDIVLIRNFR
jgi:serine/threonine protein kinase